MQSICNTLMQQHKRKERKVDKIFFAWSLKDSFGKVYRLPADPEVLLARHRLPFSFQPDLLLTSLCDPKVVHSS